MIGSQEGFNDKDPRNWRTRSGLHVRIGDVSVQVDAGPEFRMQCLRERIEWVDHFILTHGHADHLLGMDDLRRFCDLLGGKAIPVYGNEPALQRVRDVFPYAIGDQPVARGYPAFRLLSMPHELDLPGGRILSTTLPHGAVDVLGLVFEEAYSGSKVAYYTDCKLVPEDARKMAAGADVVVLDGLRPHQHPTHMSIPEAVEVALEIGAPRTYLTHLTQHVDHAEIEKDLPEGVFLAYDGLRVSF